MSKATRIEDLRKGDTIKVDGIRRNVIAAIREGNGAYTLRHQVPGHPVVTIRQCDPGFAFPRI